MISNGKMPIEQLCEIVMDIHPYVTAIHIREKQKSARELVQAVELLTKNNIPLSKIMINDRVDVAIVTRARGVQLAFHSLDAALVKENFPQLVIGSSIHSYEEGKKAKENGADYVLYGHVFPSQSKPGMRPKGIEELSMVTKLDIPVIAIGGITPENTRQVLQAGAKGIAVMSGVLEAHDPLLAIKAYINAIAIIGGGINGTSIAYQLSKMGRKAIIIEKDQLACQASSAAAGMLAAQAEIEQDGPLFQLALKSQAMFPALTSELYEYSGIDIEYVNKGMFKIAETDELANEVKKQVAFQRKWDPIQWLDAKELQEMEPSLSPNVVGAMYLPNDGHVQPAKLTEEFAQAAVYFGAEIRENTEVLGFIYDNGQVKEVKTTKGLINSDQVVVTTGAWAAKLMRESGLDINVYPVKGECFSVKTEKPIINTTIF